MNVVFFYSNSLDTSDYGFAVVEESVHNEAGGDGKCEEVDHRIGSWEVEGTICVVALEIEGTSLMVEDGTDIIRMSKTIVGRLTAKGHIAKEPGLRFIESSVTTQWMGKFNSRWCSIG